MNAQKIGNRVKSFRENYKWKIQDLADKARVHANTIRELEKGNATGIQIDTLEKIAIALGVDVVALIQGASQKHETQEM